MTKRIMTTVLFFIILFCMHTSENQMAYAEQLNLENINYTKSKDIRVISDEGPIEFDVSPSIKDNRTLVPMRAIFEKFGLAVKWDDKTKTASGTKEDMNISFTIGSSKVKVNKEEKSIDVSASIIGDRTMIPLRFLSENMGYNVLWVEESNVILLSNDKISEEWKYGGYETFKPYKEYEIKYINGVATPITRYTGTNKQIVTDEENQNNPDKIEDENIDKPAENQDDDNISDDGNNAGLPDDSSEDTERDIYSDGVARIYLSPSNQPKNKYSVGDTTEKNEMEAVAVKIKEIMDSEYNCEVIMGSTFGNYYTGRPLEAYELHSDIYLAIHSNATGLPAPTASGAIGFYHPSSQSGKQLASNIVEELNKVAPQKSNRYSQVVNGMESFDGYGLGEIREPDKYGLIAVLVETNFHDNPITADWIINNKDSIARAYVNGLVKTFNISHK